MKWSVTLTVTFLLFYQSTMAYRHHWHDHWGHDSDSSDSSSSDDSSSDSSSSNDSSSDDSSSRDNKHFDQFGNPDFSHHHHHHYMNNFPPHNRPPYNNVYKTTTTRTTSTTRTTTEPTTKFRTKPTEKITTKPTEKITIKPTEKITTKPTEETTIKPRIESTTAPIKIPTTTTREFVTEATKNSTQDFVNCMILCLVTSESNPVCEINSVTYIDPGFLLCAKNCELAVEILRTSPCLANTTQILPTTQSPSTTMTTAKTLSQQQCINSCDRSLEWRPVCGSNGVTYKNAQDLLCSQFCGIDVQFKKMTACTDPMSTTSTTARSTESVPPLPPLSTLPTLPPWPPLPTLPTLPPSPPLPTLPTLPPSPPLPTLSTSPPSPPLPTLSTLPPSPRPTTSVPVPVTPSLPPHVSHCIKALCPIYSDYKPVCGTDGVTYKNPRHLQCAKTCGVNVKMKHPKECPQGNNIETTIVSNPRPVTPPSIFNQKACIEACNTDLVYNPVCGSNDVTYRNAKHLECAQSCNVQVQMKHRKECLQENNIETTIASNPQPVTPPDTFNQEACIEACNTDSVYNPVCGSNDVTYRNAKHLECAQSCNVDVTLDTFSACKGSEPAQEITTITNNDNVITTTESEGAELAPRFTKN